ncbi:hypothetical protein GmHk_14G040128 [Glycine max]|nr:hypothetical protein GmHk_14G040128 [Glycine max]
MIRNAAIKEFLKKKYLNSRAAIEDTYFSTKDTFERHRVVFTVGTSIASVATAWFGYSLRHLHDTKVDQRLQSIENSMKNNSNLQHSQIKDIVAGSASGAFRWRGGIWYATKKFRKEQMKMLGQITPKRWQLLGKIKPRGFQFQFLRRKLTRFKVSDTATKNLKRV